MEEKDIKLALQPMLIFLSPYEISPTTYKTAKKWHKTAINGHLMVPVNTTLYFNVIVLHKGPWDPLGSSLGWGWPGYWDKWTQ